jgi:tetratricopeptide (TPR) repeat protein
MGEAEAPDEGVPSRGEGIAIGLALDPAARKRRRRTSAPSAEEQFLAAESRKLELEMHHLRLSHFDRLLTVALKLLTAALGLLIAVGLGFMVVQAARADSVVVDAFKSPPALAAQGLDGTVVASKLLDQLHALQMGSQAAAAHRGIKDAWSSDIKVEVPETGVSIGELEHYLHAWLGHETHVSGDIEAIGDRVNLTVRGDGLEAKSFEGARDELPQLVTRAAEYIYSEAEPYLASAYFEQHGRVPDALAVVRAKFPSAKPDEKPYLLNAWGNGLASQGDVEDGLARYEEAVREKPDYWVAYSNVINALWSVGREEDAWRAGLGFARAARRGRFDQRAPETYFQFQDMISWNLPAAEAELIDDLHRHGGTGSSIAQTGPMIAYVAMQMHDPQQAQVYLESSPNAGSDTWVVAMTRFVHGWGALDAGDYGLAASELEAFADLAKGAPLIATQLPGTSCWVGKAEEMVGRRGQADQAIAAGGRLVDCYRFRADILDHRGDWSGAQKAYAEAVALAPDLPAAYYSWGLALARHGDLAGAEAKYALASARGPHWADPLKAWGDALAAQGRWREAQAKYEQARPAAPKWTALQVALANAKRHPRN